MSAAEPLFDPVQEFPDYCGRDGAFRLKLKIEAYWRERGHIVHITLREAGFHPAIRANRYDVRSDMFNGRPLPAAIKRQEAA
jgi:hypothetical protein